MTAEEIENLLNAFYQFVETEHRGVIHQYQIPLFIEKIKPKDKEVKNDTVR